MTRRRKAQIQALPNKRKKNSLKLDISKNTAREIWGIMFALLATLSALAILDNLGQIGLYLKDALIVLFGRGSLFLPFILGFLSLSFFLSKNITLNYTRFFGLFLVFFGALGFYHTFLPSNAFIEHADKGGGVFGLAASAVFYNFFGLIGSRVILAGIFLIGAIVTFHFSLTNLLLKIWKIILLAFTFNNKEIKKKTINELEIISHDNQKTADEKRKKFESQLSKNEKKDEKPLIAKSDAKWEFPSLDLLSSEKSKIFADEKLLRTKAERIREKLSEFGIDVEMASVHTGPTVTQFTLRPLEGIKVSKITSLKKDLALALSARSIRIEAPIPGKNLVGIEIPNEKRTIVHLREILESENFRNLNGTLRLAVGKDVSGEAIAFDLAEMPHLLIAGATGSGKSVGMNTFLLSLLYQNSPADLKMILIDPKRVELVPFNGIAHLLTPVITDAEKALNALRWAVAEMMRRYTELSEKGFRNITEFNSVSKEKMPKIIIVIDELADLMMRQFRKDTENVICRIAQMARAVGMHLIIATQRPSVDVITGLIKANIPTRISFAVTSSIDSRTILDSIGAEDLLGQGDMLFSNSTLSKPLRVQGIYVASKEIEKVTNHIKLSGDPDFDEKIFIDSDKPFDNYQDKGFGSSEGGDNDDLLNEAIEVIRSTGKASASLLQRRLSVGYARAARILDILEERGMIGPARGAKPREIYL